MIASEADRIRAPVAAQDRQPIAPAIRFIPARHRWHSACLDRHPGEQVGSLAAAARRRAAEP